MNSLSGTLESRLVTVTPLSVSSTQGDLLEVTALLNREVLRQPFTFPGGLTTAAGDYNLNRVKASLQTVGFRKLALTLEGEAGNFFDGRRFDTRLGMSWQPNRYLLLRGQYATNRLDLPAGAFTARVYALTGNLAITPRWAWLNLAQYDNVSRRLGVNSRIRWVPTLGQVAYVVVNRDWLEDVGGGLSPTRGEVTVKASYTFRW